MASSQQQRQRPRQGQGDDLGPASKRQRGVDVQYGAPIKAKPVIQPASQQGTVVLNCYASPRLSKTRSQAVKLMNSRGNIPPYPEGTKDCYNVQTRELVFRSAVKHTGGDPRFLLRTNATTFVYTSMNGLDPEREQPVFVGAADTAVAFSSPDGQHTSTHDMLSVAIHGTRTLPVGPDVVQMGDAVIWEMPYMVRRNTDQMPRPGLQRPGVNPEKCIAHVKPMPFEYHGSANHYRNVISNFLGNFGNGIPAGENEHFARHLHLVQLMESAVLQLATGNGQITPLLRAAWIREMSAVTKRKEDELNATVENFTKAISTQAHPPTQAADGTMIPNSPNNNTIRAMLRMMVAEQVKVQTDHHMFFTNRYVGIALGNGSNGGVDVFIRGGANRC